MRYKGTDNAIMIKERNITDAKLPYAITFIEQYHREFGFELYDRDILIDDFRVRAYVPGPLLPSQQSIPLLGPPTPSGSTRAYFENGWENGEIAVDITLLVATDQRLYLYVSLTFSIHQYAPTNWKT
jgi:5-oxoprolinase (ATP-hydrolysing)